MARKKSIQDIREQMRRIANLVSATNRSVGQRRRAARNSGDLGESYNQWKRSQTAVRRGVRALEAGQRYIDNVYNKRGGYVNTDEYKKYSANTYMGLTNG